jgi:Zn-finger nucleic acid-binding protein
MKILRKVSSMKCPVCRDTALAMTERNGVEVDYCPECRGIWLDRGKLDRLVERAIAQAHGERPDRNGRDTGRYDPHHDHDHHDHDRHDHDHDRHDHDHDRHDHDHDRHDSGYQKKKGGLFGDLFG